MKLNKLLIMAVLSGLAFTSCKDNDRGVDDDNRVEMDRMEADRDLELREQQRLNDENNVTARLQRNQNLSTFNEGLTRNQITQDLDRRSSMQTGTTTGQTANTTTSNQTETTTGTTNTGTTTGTTTGTATNQGTITGQNNNQGMNSAQGYTIFAPTNDAFSALSEQERNDWNSTQNRDKNTAAINYHIVDQKLTAEQLRQQIQGATGTYTIKTMQGENLTASLDGSNIILKDAAGNQARVIESDSEGSNGVIHVIDKVLKPKDMTRNDARTSTGTTTNTTTNTGNTGTTTNQTNNQ